MKTCFPPKEAIRVSEQASPSRELLVSWPGCVTMGPGLDLDDLKGWKRTMLEVDHVYHTGQQIISYYLLLRHYTLYFGWP